MSAPSTRCAQHCKCSGTPFSGSRVLAASSSNTTACAKTGHSSLRSRAKVIYSSRRTVAHCAELRSLSVREKITLKESSKASVGGGNSIDGTSAVGCAKKIVFPQIPFCRTSGEPLPKRTCFQQSRAKDNNILVAIVASRTLIFSRPIQLSLARESNGIRGRLLHKSWRQPQQTQTRPSGSPMPAHGGMSAEEPSLG